MPGAMQGFGAALMSAGKSVGDHYDLMREERRRDDLLKQQALENAMRQNQFGLQERQMAQAQDHFTQNFGLQERQLQQARELEDARRADADANRALTILQNTGPGMMPETRVQDFMKHGPEFGSFFGQPQEVQRPLPQAPDFMGPPAPSGETDTMREFRGFEPPGFRSTQDRTEAYAQQQALQAALASGRLENQQALAAIAQQRLALDNDRANAQIRDLQGRNARLQYEQEMTSHRSALQAGYIDETEFSRRMADTNSRLGASAQSDVFQVNLPGITAPQRPPSMPPRSNIRGGSIQ